MSVVGLPFSPQKGYTGGATEIESEPELRGKKKTDKKQITEVHRNWINTLACKELSRHPQILHGSVNMARCHNW